MSTRTTLDANEAVARIALSACEVVTPTPQISRGQGSSSDLMTATHDRFELRTARPKQRLAVDQPARD